MKRLLLGIAAVAGLVLASSQAWSADKLLNASYDVGRELFVDINKAFVAKHPGVTIDQSHAGTSAQARVAIQDATGDSKSAAMAQAAILNGGTYAYVPGGKASSTHESSQVLYTDPARLAAAKDVAATLGLPAGAVRKGTVPATADVLVVLGKDYKPPVQ